VYCGEYSIIIEDKFEEMILISACGKTKNEQPKSATNILLIIMPWKIS
jgi:hypothetical protein